MPRPRPATRTRASATDTAACCATSSCASQRTSGDLLLNLFVAARFPEEAELARRVVEESGCTSFALTVNETRADAAVGDGPHMLEGLPFLRERLAGVDLRVPATAFLQTNSAMCEVLYAAALGYAAPDASRPSVDLYCGIGSLSLPLARRLT